MKKKLLLSALLGLGFYNSMAETRVMVFSDPHMLSKENTAKVKGTEDAKISYYSYDVVQQTLENVIKAKPDLLLIPGDITYYGEKSGHITAHAMLQKVQQAGIQVKVIPGNHDIMNPYSVDDDKSTVTAEEFAAIYNDMGYEEGVARDANSLSWAASINDKLAVIGLDANVYDGVDQHNDGVLRTSTLKWMKDQAAKFKVEGKMVIAMVHYEIMEHFQQEISIFGMNMLVNQSTVIPTSILNTACKHHPQATEGEDANDVTLQDVQKAFADADIHYVLTGHFHVNHTQTITVKRSDGTDFELSDISTGGLTTYPCWMRTVTLNEKDESANITSTLLEMRLDDGNSDVQIKAKAAIASTDEKYQSYGFSISGLIEDYMKQENYELYDATEFAQSNSYEYPSVTYTRIFNDNDWQHLFVPFASTYSDWSENFDLALPAESLVESNDEAVYFNSVTDAATEIPANQIALVKLKADKPTGRYSITPSSSPLAIEPGATEFDFGNVKFVGTYQNSSVEGHYVMMGNKTYKINDSVSISPLRWYVDGTSAFTDDTVHIYVDNKNIDTNVPMVPSLKKTDGKAYRIDGSSVKINDDIPHGVYIINGKKTLK